MNLQDDSDDDLHELDIKAEWLVVCWSVCVRMDEREACGSPIEGMFFLELETTNFSFWLRKDNVRWQHVKKLMLRPLRFVALGACFCLARDTWIPWAWSWTKVIITLFNQISFQEIMGYTANFLTYPYNNIGFPCRIVRIHQNLQFTYTAYIRISYTSTLVGVRDFLHQSLSHDENGSLGGHDLQPPLWQLSREVMSSTAPLPWRQKLEASDVMGGVDDWWIIVTSCDITPTAIFEATGTQISLCCPFFLKLQGGAFFQERKQVQIQFTES